MVDRERKKNALERNVLFNDLENFASDKLFLSVETVNSYRKNLLFKLGARNTAVLVKMAYEHRFI